VDVLDERRFLDFHAYAPKPVDIVILGHAAGFSMGAVSTRDSGVLRIRLRACETNDTIKAEALVSQVFKSTELTPEERAAVEKLIGRPLENDEAVQLTVHRVDEPQIRQPAADPRQAAARILELAKGKTLGGMSVRELLNEGRRF
jgi:hypothetical protein